MGKGLHYIRLYRMFTPTLSRSAAKTHVDFVSGPVKIKDALYIGDELAARQDMDFIVSNKVTHIINTVVKRVPNLFEKYGIQYLSVNWTEKEPNIFDKKNNAIGMIFNFIEEAMDQGESVLVHSLHGKSRSGSVVIAYLMKKYSWSLQKTFDYVVSKKDSFKIRSHFMSQLNELEKRLVQSQTLSSGWNTASNQEDLVLANTMKNVKIIVGPEKQVARKGKKKISWGEKKVIGSEVKSSGQNYLTSTSKYSQFKDGLGIKKLRSILKDPNSEQPQQPNMDARQQKNLEQIQISPYKQNKNIETPKKTNDSWNEEERLAKSQIIGSKNTSHGHVVMNNFMGVDKPRNERYSSIPVRETKDRQKKLQSKSGSRLAPYENIISTMKSPYDINFMNRIGEGNKARKREQPREYPRNTAQQRPHSVNLDQSQKQKPLTAKPSTKEQIMYSSYANSNRNRNVWPVQRQNIIRYK